MTKGWRIGVATVAGGLILGAAWWLGSPLFLNRMVDEAAPGTMMKDDMMKKDDMMEKDAYSGMFRDGDASHHASGKATVVGTGQEQYVRLEEFTVTNGPDLFVVLVKPGMAVKDGIQLGALKGNTGNQNYMLPAGTDLMSHSQVVIWCRTFNVTFGTADLAPAM